MIASARQLPFPVLRPAPAPLADRWETHPFGENDRCGGARYRLLRLSPRGERGIDGQPIDERDRLADFYLGLDAAERRRRFHCGTSDHALRQRCLALDPALALIVGRWIGGRLSAVAELHALREGWSQAELALCCAAASRSHDVRAHLAQIAVFAGAARGCRSIVCSLDDEAAPIVAAMDGVLRDEGIVADIAGYGAGG
jgi:hypothetical protein